MEYLPPMSVPLAAVLASTLLVSAFAMAGKKLGTTPTDLASLATLLYPIATLVVGGVVAYLLAEWWMGAGQALWREAGAVFAVAIFGRLIGWLLARRTGYFSSFVFAVSARSAEQRHLMWIVCSFALALIATWPLARFAFTPYQVARVAKSTTEFWSNFYVNWTASLLFWVIVGLIGAVVALARPEDLPFADRVRILFRGSHGRSAADLETRIRQIGQMNEKISRTFRLSQWDAVRKAVLVEVDTLICVKNLLDDVESVLVGDVVIEFDELQPHPDGGKYGEFQRYRIGHTLHVAEAAPLEMTWPKFVFEHQSLRIMPAGTSEIDMKVSWWAPVSGNEPFSFVSPRFTQCIDVKFELHAAYNGPEILIVYATGDGGADLNAGSQTLILAAASPTANLPLRSDILARQKCYEFRLAPN